MLFFQIPNPWQGEGAPQIFKNFSLGDRVFHNISIETTLPVFLDNKDFLIKPGVKTVLFSKTALLFL